MNERASWERTASRLLPAGLFFTGASALACEVVFNRLLRNVFGSSHEATATVLAAYMAGLSLGSYVFGRLSPRIRRRIAAYAYLELVVALLYVAAPTVYLGFRDLGVAAAQVLDARGGATLTGVRFLLSFGFVVIPTFFMGGTLPLLVAAAGGDAGLRTNLPRLYAANTLGAAFGTLVSAYVLIGALGLDGTLMLCGVSNLVVAVLALGLSSRLEGTAAAPAAEPAAAEASAEPSASGRLLPERALGAFALAQGAVAFLLEVIWTHMIGTVIGVTVYGFATMLAAILLGIGAGSALIPVLRRRLSLDPPGLFVASQALLALCIALTLPLWDRFPSLINLTLSLKPDWSFGEREAVRLLFCLALILPAACCLGIALPSLAAAARTRVATGRLVGAVFAANTVGAILGSLFTGFALLGRFPAERLFAVAGLLALLLSLAAARRLGGPRPAAERLALATGALAVVLAWAFPGWDRPRLTAGTHYYWTEWPSAENPPGEITFFAEDAQSGFVSVERNPNTGLRTMKTNGKYESSDGPAEFQDYLSLVGGMYLERADSAFLLGLGPGRALALLHEMPFRRIEVAEFSPAIVRAAREQFPGLVAASFADPARVSVAVDDGRNRLQLSRSSYDLVVVAITGAAFAGSGSIYNRDFFELVKNRLAPGGVFLLWQQLHHVREPETRAALHTLRRVFEHVHFYAVTNGSQGYAVASSRPLAVRRPMAARIDAMPRARQVLPAAGFGRLEDTVAWSVFNRDDELRAWLRSPVPALYDDMRPGWEFDTPRGLAQPIMGLKLRRIRSPGLPAFDPPLSEAESAGLMGLRAWLAEEKQAAIELFERAEALGYTGYRAQLEAARRAP